MKNCSLPNRIFRLLLTGLLASSPCVASATEPDAAAAPAQQPLAVDIELQPEGLLIGQLVQASGAPVAGKPLKLTLADGREASAKTNADGGFAFSGVRGVAHLQSDKALVVIRGWSNGSAPPNAPPALLMVENDGVARGQHYAGSGTQHFFGRSKRLLANPLFVAGVIGTAVAVPVAISNSDDDDPAS